MRTFTFLTCLFASTLLTAQISLPVDFETSGTTYFTDFGGNSSVTGADPTNSNNTVAITTKGATAETWAGTSIGANGLAAPVPLTASATTMSIRVYSQYAGTPIHLKLEDLNDATIFVETRMYTTKENTWETIVFDFNNHIPASPALDLNVNYQRVSVFFNFGTDGITGGQRDFYWDDLQMGGTSTTLGQVNLPVTFETQTVSYALVDFENNSSIVGQDPVNANNTVAITTKPITTSSWSGTIVGTRNGFVNSIPFNANNATISMRVYSPDANTPIMLKAESVSDLSKTVEVLQYTTKSNEWEVMTWNFFQHLPNSQPLDLSIDYSLLAIFFNFGVDGATAGEKTYYWDDVTFGTNVNTTKVNEIPLIIYPNPAQDVLNIDVDGQIDEINIFNTLGQVVYSEQINTAKTIFDISSLSTGIYFVKINIGNAVGTIKMIKE